MEISKLTAQFLKDLETFPVDGSTIVKLIAQLQGYMRIYRASGDYQLADAFDTAAARLGNRIQAEDLGDVEVSPERLKRHTPFDEAVSDAAFAYAAREYPRTLDLESEKRAAFCEGADWAQWFAKCEERKDPAFASNYNKPWPSVPLPIDITDAMLDRAAAAISSCVEYSSARDIARVALEAALNG